MALGPQKQVGFPRVSASKSAGPGPSSQALPANTCGHASNRQNRAAWESWAIVQAFVTPNVPLTFWHGFFQAVTDLSPNSTKQACEATNEPLSVPRYPALELDGIIQHCQTDDSSMHYNKHHCRRKSWNATRWITDETSINHDSGESVHLPRKIKEIRCKY